MIYYLRLANKLFLIFSSSGKSTWSKEKGKVEEAGEAINECQDDNTAANSVGANKVFKYANAEAGGEGVATPNKMKTQNHPFSGGTAASSTAPAKPWW